MTDTRGCGSVEKGDIVSSMRFSHCQELHFDVIASDSKGIRTAISTVTGGFINGPIVNFFG